MSVDGRTLAVSLITMLAASAGQAADHQAIPLGAPPSAVRHFCVRRAVLHKFTVLCPRRYPRVASSVVTPSGASLRGPSFYWASFNDAAGFDDGDDGHLILGGQRPPFSLAGSVGQAWPRLGQPKPVSQLNLPRLVTTPRAGGGLYVAERPARILRRALVLGRRALILVSALYPAGGFMGGHVIVLWNADGHGYLLSLHYNGQRNGGGYTQAERVAAALAIARSFAPVPP